MTEVRYRGERRKIGSLDCVVISPVDSQVTAVGFFCHGFGAGGDDLVGLAEELLASQKRPVQLVFPSAPIDLAEHGIPGGRAWWLLSIQRLLSALDEGHYELVRREVPDEIDTVRQQVCETIQLVLAEARLSEEQLLLAGFSQGAMLSMDVACRGLDKPPKALCLYSGALICEQFWSKTVNRLQLTKVFQSHGKLDPILPFQTGKWLRDLLTSGGCTVDFLEFNGPHSIPFEAIERTSKLLEAD